MLDCLRLVPTAKSAGALKCFFTLLNRVKVVDSGSTGQLCSSLLNSVAQCYSERKTQWNSLLRTRYGLYGNPFDPVLFDFDAPQHTKMLSNSAASYAGAISSSVTDSASAIAENAEAKEILALSMNELDHRFGRQGFVAPESFSGVGVVTEEKRVPKEGGSP